jgi:hypothetical protein
MTLPAPIKIKMIGAYIQLQNRSKSFLTQGFSSTMGKLAHSMSRKNNSKHTQSFLASEKQPLQSLLKPIKNAQSLQNV